MIALRSALVLIVALVLGVSFTLPAEDVRETGYDESEALPYEGTPLFSSMVRQPSARILQLASKSGSPFQLGSPTRCYERAELEVGSAHPTCDSLTILDHALRC